MLITSLVALTVTAATPVVPKQYATVEGLTEYRLPNGLRVVLVPDDSKPSTTVNLTVFVGSRHEGYGEKGMAHLLEHLLFKETKKWKNIKKLLTELGGAANGTTDLDRTNYFETFPATAENLDKALAIESDRLTNTIISREKLAPEMTVVRNEFESGQSMPMFSLMEHVQSAAFQWHAYGRSVIGPKSDIELVPEERIRAFYTTYYQPDNAMLVVAGKFDVKKTLARIGDTFGKLARPKRVLPTTYTVEPPQDGERNVVVRRTGGVPMLMTGYHVPAATHPDFPAVLLLSRVLAEMPSGRLAKDLIETKRATKSECMVGPQKEPGFLLCLVELRASDSAAQAREPMIAAIEQFGKRPATAEEVERARNEMLKGWELVLNSPDRVGVFLSEFAALGDWRFFFVLRDRLKAVTADDLNRVAQQYLIASNRTFGEYVPTEDPVRAEISATPEIEPLVKDYRGSAAAAEGEAFDASPKNLDARLKYATLPNGAKLALLPKKTRNNTVHLALLLRYGTEQTLRGQGVALQMAGRMLMRGTKQKTRAQITDALNKLAAEVNVAPDDQQLTVLVEVRRPQLAATLEIVGDVLKNAAFDPKEFEVLRREMVTELEQQKQVPMVLGMWETQRMLSPWEKGHPRYMPSFDEALAEINAVKVEAARDFFARFYGGQSLVISAVGDFDDAALQTELGSLFGAWSSKEPYLRIPEKFTDKGKSERIVATPDKPMAFFGVGERMQLKDTDPDYPALMMANFLLGGGFLAGRVPQRLREKDGLSYGAGTALQAFEETDNAMFFGYAIYNPINVEKVQRGFFEELDKVVASGFTADELRLGKQGLLQERREARSHDELLAMTLAGYQETGRHFAFEQAIDDKLEALTLPVVNATLKKYLDPKRLATIKVGDFKKK